MNKKLITIIDKISNFGGVLSGTMICLGSALVIAEIIERTVFNSTLYVAEEYSGYLMCGLTFVALSMTLKDKGHIRMTFLQNRLKDPRCILIVDMICYVVGFVFSIWVTYCSGIFFWDSVVNGSRSMQISETYLAIPEFFIPLGFLILALQFIAEFLKDYITLKIGTVKIVEEDKSLGR